MSLWEAVGERAAALTLLLSDAVQRNPRAYLNPLGVGAFSQFGEQPRPALYLDAIETSPALGRPIRTLSDVPFEARWLPVNEIDPIRAQLISDFSGDGGDFRDLRARDELLQASAFVAAPPTLHDAPGDHIIVRSSIGTLGAKVGWQDRFGTITHGFLTAGHVANPVNAVIHGISQSGIHVIGTVVFSHAAFGGMPRGEADVAIVSTDQPTGPSAKPKNIAVVEPGCTIQIVLHGNRPQANVKGMWAWLNFPGTNIVLANTYMTDRLVTKQGDSGAVALTEKDEVVGHVVGGTSQGGSYIQEIDYQLAVIRAQFPFAQITL